MKTTVHEIADRIYRFETVFPDIPPRGLGINQFLIDADAPLLFHAGMRALFPLVSEAVKQVMPLERLRWVSFGHMEGDECGAMNDWLAVAPHATVVHTPLGIELGIEELAARPPRALAAGETLDLGGKRIRLLETPHLPHNWEAAMLFEESTRTLFAGDFGTNLQHGRPFVDDLVDAVFSIEGVFPDVMSMSATMGSRIRSLAALEPATIAIMHGASYRGDGSRALHELAAGYEQRVRQLVA